MRINERFGLPGHFYFMGPTSLSMDSPYAVSMYPLLQRLVSEISGRGHKIGFHPGFDTFNNQTEWLRQREGLEKIIGTKVLEGRQHVLRYQADVTPDIWSEAGMQYDCTLMYPEVTGFRPGTCRPFYAYSLGRRCQLPLRQGATAISDFSLMGGKYRNLSIEDALSECAAASEVCRKYGGELVILFHTGQKRNPWFMFYEGLLARIMAQVNGDVVNDR